MNALLTDEKATPIQLLRALSQKYKHEWMGWPPSVLRQTLEQDFKVSVSRLNLIKAMAAATVATRDEFWESWETFHFLCQALNGEIPNAQEQQEHSVGQMMLAVATATQIRKELAELSNMPQFSEEVARYIAAQALAQGIWYLPSPLEFAAPYAARRSYRCRDCGNEGEVEFDDETCDVCVNRFSTESLKNWAPNQQLVKRGWGKNIEIFEKNPTDKVKARLEQLLVSPNVTLQENQTDICVAKLLASLNYLSAEASP